MKCNKLEFIFQFPSFLNLGFRVFLDKLSSSLYLNALI